MAGKLPDTNGALTRQRVELHPGTDRWMRGDRLGEVVGRRRSNVIEEGQDEPGWVYWVKMDVSGQTIRVHEENIGKWL